MIRESPSSGLGGQVGLQCDCSETCQFSVWYDTSGCRRQVVRLWSITSAIPFALVKFQPLLGIRVLPGLE